MEMQIGSIVLLIITCLINAFILLRYLVKIIKFKIFGNRYIPMGVAFILCIAYAAFANFNPAVGQSNIHPFVNIGSGIFDAIRMMALAYDRTAIAAYFDANIYHVLFGVGYVLTSFFALLWTSIAIVVIFFKAFLATSGAEFRKVNSKKNVYYIFSDPKVTVAAQLGEALKEKKESVTMILTRGSQKTQEGTEYRDMLASKGFAIRIENYSKGLGNVLFNRHFNKRFGCFKKRFYKDFANHKVYVYGLFSDDEESLKLANTFKKAILENKNFKKLDKKFTFYRNKGIISDIKNDDKINEKLVAGLVDLLKLAPNKRRLELIKNCSVEYLKANKELYEKEFEILDKELYISDLDIEALKSFKIYLTYHETDIDITNHYSDNTYQIINALSEYDMISSEFMLNNQIDKFIRIEDLLKSKQDNKSMHVTFFGLGKVNRPILRKMTYAYQLWKDNEDKITYHIVDQEAHNRVDLFENDFTKDNSDPILYRIIPEDYDDIRSFEKIDRYVKDAKKDKNRFLSHGFEVFVVSIINTSTDINVSLLLRKALFKNLTKEQLARTVIFVRISSVDVANNFVESNSPFAMRQEGFDKYDLFDDSRNEKAYVPIVVFGENVMMSDYLINQYSNIEKVGIKAVQTYYEFEEERDAKITALMFSKKDTIGNNDIVYSLRPKYRLFNYVLNKDFSLTSLVENNKYEPLMTNVGFKKLDYYKNPDERVRALAALEHNRWMTVNAVIDHFGKWDFKEFAKTFKPHEKKGVAWDTKDKNKSRHVCMLSNAELAKLGEFIVEETKKNSIYKGREDKIKTSADKLVFYNDVDNMSKIFTAFNE